VGGARTALFCWLFARKHGGQFILRVEDTDEARNTEEARQAIFDGLNWLGLDWDEGPDVGGDCGPYYQSQRAEIYDRYFQKLLDSGRVYESDGAWRFRFERCPVTVHDLVCGDVTIDYTDKSNTPDMVVRRSDGSYVFHFVNVVDHLMNTPKHLQLIDALGAVAPAYAHIPLIQNENGSKMSKRDLGAAVADYPAQGYLPVALVNFLALLGWSSKTTEEIFSMEELVQRFSLEAVNRAPARFDAEKCSWFNQQHIMKMSDADFSLACEPFVRAAELPVPANFIEIAASIKEKVRLLTEVPSALAFLLVDDFSYEEETVAKVKSNAATAGLLDALVLHLNMISAWSAESAKEAVAAAATANGAKAGQLMFPLRVALSGKHGGPDLAVILTILGKDRVVERVEKFVKLLA
jgi:glutamyl-tRNA synthetase